MSLEGGEADDLQIRVDLRAVIYDLQRFTAAVLDRAGAYAITRANWSGDLPEDVTRIDVPTAMAWSITRTVLSGEADLPNVYAIQAGMKLLPLSAYLSG